MTARVFDAFVFDFDGVLVDSADAYLSVLSELVAPVRREDWPRLYGMTTEEAADFAAGGTIPQPRLEKLCVEIDRRVGEQLASSPPERMGATEFVRTVRRQGLSTAVASSASRYAIDGAISALGWRDLFDHIVGREDAARAKPFPDVYAEAARCLHVEPKRCVAVEDTHIGVIAARDAGMYTIALGGTQKPHELSAANAYFDDFEALSNSAWFRGLCGDE
jgi:HAD superfamily hydrolase (TIGR01509 family)